jgi:hypothetical protein
MSKNRLLRRAAIVMGTLVAFAVATSASAEDRRVKIINETSVAITHFYGSNAGSGSWEEDILGQDTLAPNQSVIINFDDVSGYCKFDFKVKFSDGDEVIREGVDVCESTVYRLSE